MSEIIYSLCGVTRPQNTVDSFMAGSRRYAALARAAGTHHADFVSVVKGVQAENEGHTTDAMSARMQGQGSAPFQFDRITESAARTGIAYAEAGQAFDLAVLTMDATTLTCKKALQQLLRQPTPDSFARARAVVRSTTTALKAIESKGLAAISAAFASATAPTLIDVGAQRPNEAISPEVAARWQSLTDAQRRQALEEIIADYCKKHGIDPPPPLEYFDGNSPEGQKGWGGYWDGTTLHINSDTLNDPVALNIALHETGHAVQSYAMKDYESYSAQQIADMKSGRAPDAFSKYGLTAAEVERLREAQSKYSNSDWSYRHSPLEIDATRNNFEWSDQLTVATLNQYVH